jgi:hypothetical protein
MRCTGYSRNWANAVLGFVLLRLLFLEYRADTGKFLFTMQTFKVVFPLVPAALLAVLGVVGSVDESYFLL